MVVEKELDTMLKIIGRSEEDVNKRIEDGIRRGIEEEYKITNEQAQRCLDKYDSTATFI